MASRRRAESARMRPRRRGRREAPQLLEERGDRGASLGCSTGTPRRQRQLLCRRRRELMAASPRPIRLRHDGDHGMPRFEQRGEASGPRTPACRNTRFAAAGRLPSSRALQLLDLSNDQVPLDAAQAIDEQRAVEVIHLVLERARQQLVPFDVCSRARRDRVRARPRAPAGRRSR